MKDTNTDSQISAYYEYCYTHFSSSMLQINLFSHL